MNKNVNKMVGNRTKQNQNNHWDNSPVIVIVIVIVIVVVIVIGTIPNSQEMDPSQRRTHPTTGSKNDSNLDPRQTSENGTIFDLGILRNNF